MTCGLAALTTFPSGYSQLRQEGKSWLCTTNYPDGQRYRKYSMSKRKRYQSTMLVSVRWARSREGGHLRKATTCQNSEEVKWNWGHVVHSCPTLCDPMDYTVHGILQARMLEWVAFPFSRGSSRPRDWTWISHIAGRCFTIWATWEAPTITKITCQVFSFLGFPRLNAREKYFWLSHQ